jgi:ElaB/YqjD/DUF883 family membrane-anchored ribosome-binding protein
MVSTPEKDFQNDLAAIRADVAALADTVGKLAVEAGKAQAAMTKTVRQTARKAVNGGHDIWDETSALGHDTAEAAVDAAHAGISSIEKEIKRNPVGAVLVALGIGFLVGTLGHK